MATHSSVLAWRIPGTGEPGGLPSMGSHRVGHNWSNAAAATAAAGSFIFVSQWYLQSLNSNSKRLVAVLLRQAKLQLHLPSHLPPASTISLTELSLGPTNNNSQPLKTKRKKCDSVSCSSHLTLCDPMHCSQPGFLCPRNSTCKNSGVGRHSLLQSYLLDPGMKPESPAL